MPNPHGKNLEEAVMSASKEELTLMLYDGAVNFCDQALAAMETGSHEQAKEYLTKVQNIVREFQITLDKSHGIAQQLNQMYDYLFRRLLEANMSMDSDIVIEVREHLSSLRDTWKEVMPASVDN
jgi:flagellar protein FliS